MSDASPYREFAPRASLRDVVRSVWIYEARGPETEPQRIAPDGCTELIIHVGAPYAELGATGVETQPPILFAGQITQPLTLVAGGDARVLGVRFEPDGARAFLGRPMSHATDRRLDLVELHGPCAGSLLRAIRSGRSWEARMAMAENYVEGRIECGPMPIDPVVRNVVCMLEIGECRASLRLEVSERQLQRRFLDRVGVSPRTLSSILRFRRVFDATEQPQRAAWVEAALAAGYFDQPQMARDFRRFLGCTASAWVRQKAGLATLIAHG